MTREQLCELTIRMLDQLELEWGRIDDEPLNLVACVGQDSCGDLPIFIEFDELRDSDGVAWPVILLDLAVLEGVDGDLLPSRLVADVNDELMVGKLALDSEGRLAVQHAMIGWPGAAEYRVAMEAITANADALREQFGDDLAGNDPVTYDDLLA